MDIKQERREEVMRFLREHDKKFVCVGNLYHAEKLFFIFSLYSHICESQESGEMNSEEVQYNLELINKYIRDEIKLSWDPDGILVIE
jgi:hypothetical protein